MMRAQVNKRGAAEGVTAALTLCNLTVQAESKALGGIRAMHGASSAVDTEKKRKKGKKS